jgi:two-component system NarL family response regulator
MTQRTAPIRVVIVDGHSMVVECVQAMLESYVDTTVLATLPDGRDIIERADELNPDVILLDLNMPGIGGLSPTELLLVRRPQSRILIVSLHDSPEYISSALSHGAMGYTLKDMPSDEIKHAIDRVMAGDRYLCTGAQVSLPPEDGQPPREQLTNREQTILLQLAQGKSNRDVAASLNISVRTAAPPARTSSASWAFPQPPVSPDTPLNTASCKAPA